jgi:hypothetical protein
LIGLGALLLVASSMPEIAVKQEAGVYRLTVAQFSWSQGPAVNELIAKRMAEVCKGHTVEQLEFDLKTIDAMESPTGERLVWDYWATFKCVDPPTGG